MASSINMSTLHQKIEFEIDSLLLEGGFFSLLLGTCLKVLYVEHSSTTHSLEITQPLFDSSFATTLLNYIKLKRDLIL